jgi:hypothetical protein
VRTAIELAGVYDRSPTDTDATNPCPCLEETERRWVVLVTALGGRSGVLQLAGWGWLGAEIPCSSAGGYIEGPNLVHRHKGPPRASFEALLLSPFSSSRGAERGSGEEERDQGERDHGDGEGHIRNNEMKGGDGVPGEPHGW